MSELERPTTVTKLSCGPVEYRLERHGRRTVLILHGGHVRASLPLGEEVFVENGYSVLAPLRPGYGNTPLTTGTSPALFSDAVAELCGKLGISRLVAAVGQSAGGPTAVTLASRHPDLVERLILQSAVGFLPWPDRRTRISGRLVFSARAEKATWAAIHTLVRRAPQTALRLLLRDLTTRPASPMIGSLTAEQRSLLLNLFATMRSGAGFATDLKNMADDNRPVPMVTQPTLVIAAPDDGAVPYGHAQALAAAIRRTLDHQPSHPVGTDRSSSDNTTGSSFGLGIPPACCGKPEHLRLTEDRRRPRRRLRVWRRERPRHGIRFAVEHVTSFGQGGMLSQPALVKQRQRSDPSCRLVGVERRLDTGRIR